MSFPLRGQRSLRGIRLCRIDSPFRIAYSHLSLPKRKSSMNTPHRRFNPLTNDWVLVSPQRTQRPWLGQVDKTPPENLPAYDPTCYLCPGNERAGGHKNPPYTSTFVFDNDYAALIPDAPDLTPDPSPLLRAEAEPGRC